MSDFQGLMMEPEGSDDGASKLPAYQTLKANHGQSVFHENINKSKHGWVALFHYEVLASTFRFHHQTLETNHG
ncbi:hypothetical protein EVAR_57242_1 [Eumeta japonica]|uniref:Uncharacterized protein n=1 Tax=Eumeta variegata TaxID=151549 RepID=A0A4C1YTB4_EUMVA|nr:hypothetical protein EVAR_57242_1 [Eumeta japonica]